MNIAHPITRPIGLKKISLCGKTGHFRPFIAKINEGTGSTSLSPLMVTHVLCVIMAYISPNPTRATLPIHNLTPPTPYHIIKSVHHNQPTTRRYNMIYNQEHEALAKRLHDAKDKITNKSANEDELANVAEVALDALYSILFDADYEGYVTNGDVASVLTNNVVPVIKNL